MARYPRGTTAGIGMTGGKLLYSTFLIFSIGGLLTGCATMPSPTGPPYSATSAEQSGVPAHSSQIVRASWYGAGFNGRPTTSGELFHQNALTAASRTLPLGSRVKVSNLANGRSVVVRINDRGPYVKGRSIDLSRAAAERLGMANQGLGTVKISRVDEGFDRVEPASASVPSAPISHAGLDSIWSGAPHHTRFEAPPRESIWHVKVYPYHSRSRRRSRRIVSDPVGSWLMSELPRF
jgi:rare lipoprotein A